MLEGKGSYSETPKLVFGLVMLDGVEKFYTNKVDLCSDVKYCLDNKKLYIITVYEESRKLDNIGADFEEKVTRKKNIKEIVNEIFEARRKVKLFTYEELKKKPNEKKWREQFSDDITGLNEYVAKLEGKLDNLRDCHNKAIHAKIKMEAQLQKHIEKIMARLDKVEKWEDVLFELVDRFNNHVNKVGNVTLADTQRMNAIKNTVDVIEEQLKNVPKPDLVQRAARTKAQEDLELYNYKCTICGMGHNGRYNRSYCSTQCLLDKYPKCDYCEKTLASVYCAEHGKKFCKPDCNEAYNIKHGNIEDPKPNIFPCCKNCSGSFAHPAVIYNDYLFCCEACKNGYKLNEIEKF